MDIEKKIIIPRGIHPQLARTVARLAMDPESSVPMSAVSLREGSPTESEHSEDN